MATAGVTRSLVPNASLPAKVQPLAPNQTLYITNLPSSKIQKADLRTALYMLFSTFGPVLDVVALKTMSMRGQAHIVFRDIQSATQAMRSLDGQSFLGKPLKIQYAKGKSHFVSKLDGSFKPPNASGAAGIEQTELQQSIFNAPPPAALTSSNKAAPAKPAASADQEMKDVNTSGNRGHKRSRDDDDDSDSDVAMEEDSDDE